MAGVQGQRPVEVVTQTGDSAMDDTNNAIRVNVVAGGGSGGTSAADDSSFSVASGSGTPVMGLADETDPDSVDEGDVGVVRMTLTRALHVNLRDSAGAEVAVGGGTQYTEDAAAAANPVGTALIMVRDDALSGQTTTDGDNVAARGTDKGELYVKHVDAIPVTDNSSTLSVDDGAGSLTVDNTVLSVVGSGTEATAQRVTIATDSTGVLSVDDNGSSLTIDQSTASNLNAQVVGSIAHDSADSGNPVKVGAKAIAHGTNPTAVTAADRTDIYANRHGILWTIGGHPNVITRSVLITDANGAQTDASIAGAIGSGTKVAVTEVIVTVDASTTNPTAVRLGFGTANVPTQSSSGVAGMILDHPGIAPGSGMVRGNGSAVIAIGADDEELRLTCEDPTGGNLTVTFSYFTIES